MRSTTMSGPETPRPIFTRVVIYLLILIGILAMTALEIRERPGFIYQGF